MCCAEPIAGGPICLEYPSGRPISSGGAKTGRYGVPRTCYSLYLIMAHRPQATSIIAIRSFYFPAAGRS